MTKRFEPTGTKRRRHAAEVLFGVWCGAAVLSVLGVAVLVLSPRLGVPAAWGLVWLLVMVAAPLWLEPLQLACRPERLKSEGAWRHSPRRYDRRTLRVLPVLVPVVLVVALSILELGYGIFAPAGRRVAPDGLRFGIAAAALVSVPGAFLVSQLARARFRREVEGLGDCFGCGYSLRGIGSGVCPECGAARGSAP